MHKQHKPVDLTHQCNLCKQRVHQLTNTLQLVISYLEMKQYGKALKACKDAVGSIHDVAEGIVTIIRQKPGSRTTHSLPVGSIVTVPAGTHVEITGSLDQLTVDTPADELKKKDEEK